MVLAYQIVFAVGVLYTFVSFLISGISGAFHFGSHIGHIDGHFGGHSHMHGHYGGHGGDMHGHQGHAAAHGTGFSETFFSWFSILINPIVAVSFLTVFGGIGIMGTDYFKWTPAVVLFIALTAGIITAFLLYRFVAVPLYKSENSTDVSRNDLIGTPAEVISAVLENGFGEIKYTINSLRYTAPAKHVEGKAVMQGKKVLICKIENNIFYVSEIEGF